MGRPDGFMIYERKEQPALSPAQRLRDFHEFHASLSETQRREQAARCMNCGVPLCQSAMVLGGMVSGCPLHNLIPEWNDELYHGNDAAALARLLATNPFPEFTGRVCPALCEKACICGMNGDPVTIRENELSIIEKAFKEGRMKPSAPVRSGKKVAVVGSGPSGLAAAWAMNCMGHEVHVYERDELAGGLLMYGIPNMKLEKTVVERRVALMAQEGIVFHLRCDVGKDIAPAQLYEEYDAVALCCGARAARDLKGEGRDGGQIVFAVDFLSAVTRSLADPQAAKAIPAVKDRHIVVVGGGDTGNDCVGSCIRLGCADVIQLEMMPALPKERAAGNPWPQWPRVLKTDYGQEESIACFGRDPRIYQTTIQRFLREDGVLRAVETVDLRFDAQGMHVVEGSARQRKADLVIIAAGFTGLETYVSDAFALPLSQRHTAKTEAGTYLIDADKGLFAAGDAKRGPSLVVWAIREGLECAEQIDRYLQ